MITNLIDLDFWGYYVDWRREELLMIHAYNCRSGRDRVRSFGTGGWCDLYTIGVF